KEKAGRVPGLCAARTALFMLVIVLFAVNTPTLLILRHFDLTALARCHFAIGHGARFHALYALLAMLQACGLLVRQRTRFDAFFYTALLIGLALIDARGRARAARLCFREPRNGRE